MKKSIFSFSVRDLCEIPMLCAVAILLDTFVKIDIGVTGGSINIAMLPLFIIALRHGWFKGLISGGVIFGLITCFLLDRYSLAGALYPLEYFAAFGSVAITGIFASFINKKFEKGNSKGIALAYAVLVGSMVLAGIIRFICGTIDSMLFYGYDFVGAIVYNFPYVFISLIIVIILNCILMPTIKILNNRFPTSYIKEHN